MQDNNFSQQNNDDNITQNAQNASTQNVSPFGIDLSSYKKDDGTNLKQTSVSISPEVGPILIDNQGVEKAKDVQYGNEILKNIENEKNVETAEKKEAQRPPSEGLQMKTDDIKSVTKVKDDNAGGKILPQVKYDGFPIDEEIIKDPERVKHEKGKGDIENALTAIFIFLDKLFRKQKQ